MRNFVLSSWILICQLQLRNAVNKGFVRVELLSQQLSPEKISMLNQLLQKVPR